MPPASTRLRLYWWTLGPLAIAAYAGAQYLPVSTLREFSALLAPWIAGALVLLSAMHVAPLPVLSLGQLLGRKLPKRWRLSEWVFLALCCGYFVALAGTLSGLLFHHIPHINDSLNQYVHAKFIAGGHVSITSHPLKEFFDSGWMVNDGRWYSVYSPAHILLLAVGWLAGLPWLVNPVLGALTVVAIYFLARELYGIAAARVSALLACACPFLIFMSSEYMNHATALLFATLFMLFTLRTLRTFSWKDAMLAGAAFGVLALTRPYTALGIGLPYLVLGGWRFYRHHRALIKPLGAFALVLLCGAAFQLWWNLSTTGNAFEMAYHHMMGNEHMPGFGRDPWGDGPHTFLKGLTMAMERIADMNTVLFEWPLPALVFVLALVLSGTLRLADGMLLATYGSLMFVYMFFQGRSEVFGPRYHYEAIGALIVLTAAAIVRLPAIYKRYTGRNTARAAYGIAACALLFCYALAFYDNLAYRYRLYSHHYREGNVDYYYDIVNSVRTPALVFVHDRLWPYLYVAFTLPPTPDAPIIFARDKKAHNAALVDYYPCRFAYVRDENDRLWELHQPAADCR